MSRIIDLTQTLTDGMRGVTFQPAMLLDRDGWNARTLTLYSHCATHIDAPRHFQNDGPTIDDVPLDACVGPAIVLDLTPIGEREEITPERLQEAMGTPSDCPERLLLRTDWSHRLGTPSHRDALPRLTLEAARWLVDQGVRLVGVEPPSVADVHNIEEVQAVHRVLLDASVVIVEGLVNLDQLGDESFTLVALPLKIEHGDGSPARVIAITGSP